MTYTYLLESLTNSNLTFASFFFPAALSLNCPCNKISLKSLLPILFIFFFALAIYIMYRFRAVNMKMSSPEIVLQMDIVQALCVTLPTHSCKSAFAFLLQVIVEHTPNQ